MLKSRLLMDVSFTKTSADLHMFQQVWGVRRGSALSWICAHIFMKVCVNVTYCDSFVHCAKYEELNKSRCFLSVFQVLDGLLAQCGTVENCEQGKTCDLSSCVPDVPHILTRC